MSALPGTARRRRLYLVGAALGLVAALTLTGCAAGQQASTADEVPVVDGVSANVGAIQIRAAAITAPTTNSYPKGSDAPLQLVIINNALADQLVSVSTPAATSVAFYQSAAAVPSSAGTDSVADSSGTDSSGTDSSGSATDTTAPTDVPSDSGAPAAGAAADGSAMAAIDVIPGSTSIGLSSINNVILLKGLTAPLFPAQTITITFQFKTAGSVTFPIAVHLAAPPATPATAPTSAPGSGNE